MTKVAFLIQDQTAPSTRVRVSNLLPGLRAAGVEPHQMRLPAGFTARFRLFRELRQFDAVILQKKLLGLVETALLRRYAHRLVYDFDDAVYLRDLRHSGMTLACTAADNDPRYRSWSRRLKFTWIIRHCDAVLAGNSCLAKAARHAAGRHRITVTTLPSAVPTIGVPQRDTQPDNARPVVGWVGSSGTLPFVSQTGNALAIAANSMDFELRMICDRSLAIPGVHCTHVPWLAETQEQEISRFDVGIMPLPDTPWTRGKCAYKLLQYMAGGVPFVASAVGMNCEVADGERAGLLADSTDAFASQLLRLLHAPALRKTLGGHGRILASKTYSTEVVAGSLSRILFNLADNSTSTTAQQRIP